MSIGKKIILSNIILLIVPVTALFLIDIVLGYFIIIALNGSAEVFTTLRFLLIILVFVLVNIAISITVSRHIIAPVLSLNRHAKQIGEGQLEEPIIINRSDEIGELAGSFETMRQELKASKEKEYAYFKNRQELMASMSHDLKTPLTSMKGYINGLEDGVADTEEKRLKYTQVVKQSVNHLEKMIDELFMYSKLDLEEENFNFDKVELTAYIKDIINEYQLEHSHLMIHLHISEQIYVHADREQLYRAISNIIDNSIKYGHNECIVINVYLYIQGNDAWIDIQDNGTGIEKSELPKVFEAFHRTDHSRNSKTGGTGLGLSIVKRIIERHNGEVGINSELDKGTTISIRLQRVIV